MGIKDGRTKSDFYDDCIQLVFDEVKKSGANQVASNIDGVLLDIRDSEAFDGPNSSLPLFLTKIRDYVLNNL